MKEKKKMSKGKKILIVLAAVVVLSVAAALSSNDTDNKTITNDSILQESKSTEPTKQEEIPAREESIGKSDKNADELIDGSIPRSMRNDVTGNWKLVTYASTEGEVEKYALDYYNKYFGKNESNEVHWLVNFTNKTTTSISCLGAFLEINTYEYVDKEEHDAHAIGGGMLLSSHFVWLDNGDIEKVQ